MDRSRQPHLEQEDLLLLVRAELTPRRQARAWEHLRACPECAAEHRRWVALLQAVANPPPVALPPRLERQVFARLAQERARRTERRAVRRRRFRLCGAGALAAAVLVMGGLILHRRAPVSPPDASSVVAQAPPPAGPSAGAPASPSAPTALPPPSGARFTAPGGGQRHPRPDGTSPPSPPRLAASTRPATVRNLEGKPIRVHLDRASVVTPGSSVAPGDELRTGDTSRLLVELPDQGQLLVDFDSRLRIVALPASASGVSAKVEVRQGRLWAFSPGDGGEIQAQTPRGTMRVNRGEAWVRLYTGQANGGPSPLPTVEVIALRGQVGFTDREAYQYQLPPDESLLLPGGQGLGLAQPRPLARTLRRSGGWGKREETWEIRPLTLAELLAQLAAPRLALGLRLAPPTVGSGTPVAAVAPDSVAERAGVQSGDVLLQIGDRAQNEFADLPRAELELATAPTVQLRLRRGTVESVLPVEPAADSPQFPAELAGGLGAMARAAAAGQMETALQEAQRLTQDQPQAGWAWYDLALLYEYRGCSVSVLGAAKQASSLLPTAPAPQLLLGRLYARLGNTARAVGALQEAVRLGAGAPAGYLLGYIQLLAGDLPATRGEAEALRAEAGPDAQAAGATLAALASYFAEDNAGAEEQITRALRLSPGDLDAQLASALLDLSVLQVERARETLGDVLRAYPDCARALNMMGMSYYGEERWAEARPWFEQGLSLGQMRPTLLYNLGLCYVAAHRSELALPYFQQAARLAPDFAPAYRGWGAVLENQGEWRLALERYGRALTLCPGDETTLGWVQQLWAQHSHAAPASQLLVRYGLLPREPA